MLRLIIIALTTLLLGLVALAGQHWATHLYTETKEMTTTIDKQLPAVEIIKSPAQITAELILQFKENTGTTPHAIFAKLQQVAGSNTGDLTFFYNHTPWFNAYATNYIRVHKPKKDGAALVIKYEFNPSVHLFAGAIRFLIDDADAMAFLLSHEIAHHMLGHLEVHADLPYSNYYTSRYAEKIADLLAVTLARQAGYDACAGARMWERLQAAYNQNYCPISHPSHIERANYLNVACGGNL